ncbi:hypothetical protein ACEPAI_5694 [Sanghuangporus weigelae]
MGANSSKLDYEYDPTRNYYARSRARELARGPQYYGKPMGMMPAGYPVINPPVAYPLVMHPAQQIYGFPVGQMQASQTAQQPMMQMPQLQVQPAAGNAGVVPPNPMQVPQMPQMPQMPQPQIPLEGGSQWLNQVNPRTLTRTPSSSGSSISSRSSRRRRRRRREREREREMDPLARNPLPRPPRQAETPDDILAGSAMAPRGPPLPRSSSPLNNPLPPPPRDVYTLRRYRPLLVGTAYADREKTVYPRGWFSDDEKQGGDGGLGRIFERLNPFRPHQESEFSPGHRRNETMPEFPRFREFVRESSGSGSESSVTSPRSRRPGLGRSFSSRIPFMRRRRNEQMMAPPGENGLPRVLEGHEPPVGFMPMPSPTVPGPTYQPQPTNPLSPAPSQPAPAYPLSPEGPGQQAVIPPNPMLQPGNLVSPRPQGTPMFPRSPFPPQPQPESSLTPGPAPQMTMPTPQHMTMPAPGTPYPMAMPAPGTPHPMSMPTPGAAQPMSIPTSGGGGAPPVGMPTPAHPLSPVIPPVVAGQGPGIPRSISDGTLPVLRFDRNTPGYGGLTHLSPHQVVYKRKLYPTAAHLFEAHRFLDFRNDIAARVRKAVTLADLEAVLRTVQEFTRPDWEEVLLDMMEDALYHKIVQHEDLCEILLGSGNAELIYADPTDPFWGEGAHDEGANELGRALIRIRDRLRREAAGH